MTKHEFRETTLNNHKQVAKWPKWKRRIVISAYAASTGDFHERHKKRNC